MMNRRLFARLLGLAISLALLGETAFGRGMTLTKVNSPKVCMVNDRLFPNDQIPVKVGENTYYGCCAMCKKTLSESEEARTATDPISNKPVDKATAVIGAMPDGRVLYFENDKNLTAFNSGVR